ncbi:unnamed protein product [Closterium sp. NIES-53]
MVSSLPSPPWCRPFPPLPPPFPALVPLLPSLFTYLASLPCCGSSPSFPALLHMEEARTRMCMEAEDHLVTFYPSFDMRIRVLHDVISEHYVVPLILLKEAMVDKTRRDAFKRVYTQWKNERGFYIKRTVLEGLGVPMSGLRAAEVHIDTDLKEDLWGEYGPSADAQLSTWGNAEDSDLPFGNEIFFNAAMDAFGEFAVGNGICLKAYHIAWTILVVLLETLVSTCPLELRPLWVHAFTHGHGCEKISPFPSRPCNATCLLPLRCFQTVLDSLFPSEAVPTPLLPFMLTL